MLNSSVFFAFLSAFFAALVAIFGKIGVSGMDSTLATTIRAIIMALFLVFVSLSFNRWQDFSQISGKAWLFIVLAGIAGALSWLAYFYALKIGQVKVVASIDRLSVALAIIMAALFLGEALTIKGIIGIVLMLAGIYLLM